MKRRYLAGELVEGGYWSRGGTNHGLSTNGCITVVILRHKEINELTAKRILKDAGLR